MCRSSSGTSSRHGRAPSVCPRQTLKRVLARAEKLGFRAMCGLEFEWFQLRRDAAFLGAEKGRRPDAADARHVRLLTAARERQPRFFNALMDSCCLRRADRRAAHRDRPASTSGHPVFRRARVRRPRRAVQDRREGDRRAVRDHASSWRSGASSTRVAAVTCTSRCLTARRICSTTPRRGHEPALREFPADRSPR